MTIAFWNINNNSELADLLLSFVQENDVDILMLAESERKLNGKRNCLVDDILQDFNITQKSTCFAGGYVLNCYADTLN